jgi:flagellum-specific peptidoglycan hydrolase FlgJ
MTEVQKNRAKAAAQALLNNGLPKDKLPWVIAQLAFETAHFDSSEAVIDNNLSGIKYYGQKGATKGHQAPASEGSYYAGDGSTAVDYYAHYNNYDEWAKDYLRILRTIGTARPLEADTVEDFVYRLKQNKYFSGSLADYTKGVKQTAVYYAKYIINDITGVIKKNPDKTLIVVGILIFASAIIFGKHD